MGVDPGPGLPATAVIGYAHQPQQTFFYCGPASIAQNMALMGIPSSQEEAAGRMKTTRKGTAWSGVLLDYYAPDIGRSGYPLADIMSSYMYGFGRAGRYYPANVPGSPTGTDVANFRMRVMSDTASGYPVVGNVWEVNGPGNARLPGHPTWAGDDIFHIYSIHGYDTRDDTIFVTDPAAQSSAISWGSGVPKYSRLNTSLLTTLNGGRGYAW